MKKYILEIPDDRVVEFSGSNHLFIPYEVAGKHGYADTGLNIIPYTESNIETIRKEAYEKGFEQAVKTGDIFYNNGYQKGLTDAREAEKHECEDCNKNVDIEAIRKEAYSEGWKKGYTDCNEKQIGYGTGYQDGLNANAAWEAAKKIVSMTSKERDTIFKEVCLSGIFEYFIASEAIERIRQYEQEKERKEEKPITVEDVMRQYLDIFCRYHKCKGCILHTPEFTCGRGYHFLIDPENLMSNEEVRRAYAEVMRKKREGKI